MDALGQWEQWEVGVSDVRGVREGPRSRRLLSRILRTREKMEQLIRGRVSRQGEQPESAAKAP